MLFRYIRHVGYFSKTTVFSENKKIINFTIHQYTKPVIILRRTLSEITDVVKEIYTTFDTLQATVEKSNRIKRKDYESFIHSIRSINNLSEVQIYYLLKWSNNINDCSSLERVKLVESLWSLLNMFHFQLNVTHYNTLLQFYISNNYNFSLNDILTEMKNKNIVPNYITHNMCALYYCMRGNIEEAMLILKYDMYAPKGYLIKFFHALLIGYSRLGNMESINKILTTMKKKNMKPTTDTYFAVMCAYAKLNDIDKINEVIKFCHSHNMYFNNKHILSVMYTLAANNHVVSIQAMYKYLITSNIMTNEEVHVLGNLLNICDLDIARTLFLYTSLLRNIKFVNALSLLKYAIDINMHPNKTVYLCNTVTDNAEVNKSFFLYVLHYSLSSSEGICVPLALLREARLRYKVKEHYFWSLLSRHGMNCDFDGILKILTIMIEEFNITPCVHTICNYVLRVLFMKNADLTRTLLLKHKINETVLNNAYMLTYLKSCKIERASLYLRSHPDKYSYNILSHELRLAASSTNDVENFVFISGELPASMDKQLFDAMTDLPTKKSWLAMVVQCMENKNIRLQPDTALAIQKFLRGYLKIRLTSAMENLSEERQIWK